MKQNLIINLDQEQKKVRIKKDTYENAYEGRALTLNPFKSVIFPIKATQDGGLKILGPKQML